MPKLDQHRYVRTMASKLNVDKTSTTPVAAGAKPLSQDDALQTEAETEEVRVTPYREAVGALMWAATMTRPDVDKDKENERTKLFLTTY